MGKKENIRVFIYSQYISKYIEYLCEQRNQLISTIYSIRGRLTKDVENNHLKYTQQS